MSVTIYDLPDELLLEVYCYLPVSVLKEFRLLKHFANTIQTHLYRNSQFQLCLDDGLASVLLEDHISDTLLALPLPLELALGIELLLLSPLLIQPTSLLQKTGNNLPSKGIPVTEFCNLSTHLQSHICKFYNFEIHLAISNFKAMIQQLEKYRSTTEMLCNDNDYRGSNKHLQIKLVVYLSYSMNNFNDVKDSFMNIDKISKWFSNGGMNSVSVDLQLLKSER